jgi:hypothetical protein
MVNIFHDEALSMLVSEFTTCNKMGNKFNPIEQIMFTGREIIL